MMTKVLVALTVAAAAGGPAIYAATRPVSTEPVAAVAPTTSAQQTDTIICPLTGEEISPCCCPINDEKK
ncbi:MAG: hypothetical protein KF878_01125 [Planctomycetes bacterium]|nr:hypothetical protein [Planctomycetota bacterium]